MPNWLTRRRIAALSISVVVVVLVPMAYITPSAHEIHSPDSTALRTQVVVSNPFVLGYPAFPPSQSLDAIRCEIWRSHPHQSSACDSTILASDYFPNVTQIPMTLYVPWVRCSSFNVEYRSGSRSVVIHCITAEPWISTEHRVMGVAAQPQLALLLIPTDSIPAGTLDVVQDNRTEHLLHDDTYEFELGTATIT
jgi:hypothetical protein